MPRPSRTIGDRAIDWIEMYCRIPDGDDAGKLVRLTAPERAAIRRRYDDPTRSDTIDAAALDPLLQAYLQLMHFCGPLARGPMRLMITPPPNEVAVALVDARRRAGVFNLCRRIVQLSPLAEHIVVTDRQLACPELGKTLAA